MGRDLELEMAGVKKSELAAFLRGMNFQPSKSILPEEGWSYFYWFDEEEYRSYSGVEATLIPGSFFSNSDDVQWVLAARCKSWASIYDVKKMNEVIREARREFSGTVRGDYGVNRYAPLWEDDSTPLSRGVTRTYDHTLEVLESLGFAAPSNTFQTLRKDTGHKETSKLVEVLEESDPARVVLNGLVPMIVAVLEHYFYNVFLVLMQYDRRAREKFYTAKITKGLTGEKLIDLASGEIRPEELIASEYSFQNFESLSTTFKKWFDIDLKKIFSSRKRIRNNIDRLSDVVTRLISYRHDVVHRLHIDRTLNHESFLYWVAAATTMIEQTTLAIGDRYGFQVQRI